MNGRAARFAGAVITVIVLDFLAMIWTNIWWPLLVGAWIAAALYILTKVR